MSSFDSDNDFLHEDYYETNGNFYSANGVYQGLCNDGEREKKFIPENGGKFAICNQESKLMINTQLTADPGYSSPNFLSRKLRNLKNSAPRNWNILSHAPEQRVDRFTLRVRVYILRENS